MLTIDKTQKAKNLRDLGKGNRRPELIVIHDTAGSGTKGDMEYLRDDPEHRGVSVDFVILRDGTIFQLNPDLHRYSTGHAGRNTKFRQWKNNEVNVRAIGIELSHHVRESQNPNWPGEQVKAVAELCRSLCTEFGLTEGDITTHAKIITDGSRTDPRHFPFDSFWAIFRGLSTVTGNEIVGPMDFIDHTVVAGDTLYNLAVKYGTSIEAIKALNNMETPSTRIDVDQVLKIRRTK